MNAPAEPGPAAFPHVFRPVQIGSMALRNRIMVPPHGSGIGNLWGSEDDAARNIAYWQARARDGAAWVDAVRGRVQNPLIPGFEPSGYGAETRGNYRAPNYVERVQRFVTALHDAGATVTSQLTVIGGVPHASRGITVRHSCSSFASA
jgi:2,4-dienoyl-CoA reductase-like NADH-dependent reductase (Old Yellow Enzyme family)